jgi:hypothetical protein
MNTLLGSLLLALAIGQPAPAPHHTRWDVLTRAEYVRTGPAFAPATGQLLGRYMLLHETGEWTPHWQRVYVPGGKGWVLWANLRPVPAPAHNPFVAVPPVPPVVPAAAPQTTVPPAPPVVSYGTDAASIQQEVIAAGDNAFGAGQGQYMADIVGYESAFSPWAVNPSSGACGLFQANPCGKLPCSLADVPCQINWGTGYISAVYGTPYRGWMHELGYGWY